MRKAGLLLPLLVFAQFAGTSLWFAGNAIINDIQPGGGSQHAIITSIVQFGFIVGTLAFSLLTLADRFPATLLFLLSSLLAAAVNLLLLWFHHDLQWILAIRFLTGFFLAGIYPVGMKIAADCFPAQLGKAMGFLVGALVLGTAFPYLISYGFDGLAWKKVVIATSLLALSGGLLILLFFPAQKGASSAFKWNAAFTIFRYSNFRSAAFGYFGHMWELYAFWSFIPFILVTYNEKNNMDLDVSLWTFIIIATGMAGCIAGGLASIKKGSRTVAMTALLFSGICCLLLPFSFGLPPQLFLAILFFWGFMVVADSPQFSTLVAQSAPPEVKGTALTIVTSIGFAITIASIQLLQYLSSSFYQYALLILAIGPIAGLMMMKNYLPAQAGR